MCLDHFESEFIVTLPRNKTRTPKFRRRSNVTRRVGGRGYNKNPSYGPVGPAYGGSSYLIRDRSIEDYINKPFRKDGTFEPSPVRIVNRGMINYFASGENVSERLDNMWLNTHGTSTAPIGTTWKEFDKGNDAYALDLLAKTNPMAPLVMMPELIIELIQAVTVARFRVKSSIFNPGSLYLTKVFGIDTLVEDIRVLHKVSSHIEKRLSRLSSLGKHGGLRERATLDNHSWPLKKRVDYPLSTSAFSWTFGTIEESFTQKVYGTCRWRMKEGIEYDPETMQDWVFALQQVLDLESPDYNTIWNLLPFSWVIDYFSNIGDYFQSREGEELIEAYDICIMRERTVSGSHRIVSSTHHSGHTVFSRGQPYYRERLRDVVGTADGLSIGSDSPSGGQIQNLIALLVQRFLN